MAKKFVLVDSHSIIFRSYFAFIKNPLKNSKGEVTSGIYGFLNTLDKIKTRFVTDYIVLVFDPPGETFRDKIFKEYKATRPPPPQDIPFQVAKVKEITVLLGMKQYEILGYEADDVLATLAKKLKTSGDVYIVTSDKDLLQLVDRSVFIYDAYRDLIMDTEKVIEKYGVGPERIADYLSLTGDSIDNIPGVDGIGPQRALEILKKYLTIEEAVQKDKRLVEHKDEVMLSKSLVQLDCDVPIQIALEDIKIKAPDLKSLIPVLTDLEFHSYIKQLGHFNAADVSVIDTVVSKVELEKQIHIGIGIEQDTVYVCMEKDSVHRMARAEAVPITNEPRVIKAGGDLKEFMNHCPLSSPVFDVAIGAWLLDPNRSSYTVDDLGLKYLNEYRDASPARSAQTSYELYPILAKELEDLSMRDLYFDLEEPLIFVLAAMEKRGIKIDIPYFKELRHETEKKLGESEKTIFSLAGRNFNINSPKQLSQVLFEDLKLPPVKRGKSHFSTDVEVLKQLSLKHELPGEILKYRELTKINTTYIIPLVEFARDGRIHTTFDQTGTSTGRLSSLNPNIQNIPIRSELGKKIRKGFIAEDGYSFISADYSQVELRILAHMTKDKNLIKAFADGKDIHNHTASLVYNIPEDKVDGKQRRMAKVVNYGLIYGMSDYGLAQSLDIPKEEAVQFIQSYYALYSGVDAWRAEALRFAEEKGYTQTILGRRRPLPEILSPIHNVKETAKRIAINAPIQGSAADLIKLAMIEAEKKLTRIGLKQGLLLSIHDELLFEIEDSKIKEVVELIKEAMEHALSLIVPVSVTIGTGKNWAEAH
ncbi:MAG TPA: DNA polymerase I [bacterium]